MSLTQEQKDKFKEKLLETQSEINADLEKLKEALELGDETNDPDEETDESEEHAHYVGIKQPLEGRLGAIEDALTKMEEGKYGICEKCGGEIEIEVLEVVPESRLCKKCKVGE